MVQTRSGRVGEAPAGPSTPQRTKKTKVSPQEKKATAASKGKASTEHEAKSKPSSAASSKAHQLISEYGSLPLRDVGLRDPGKPTAETILALVIESLIKSNRIGHGIADKSVKALIDAGYQDVHTLKKSTWDEKTQILTDSGYSHYRQTTSTELDELADLVINKYQGDLNNLYQACSGSPTKIRSALKEIKGLGDLAVDIFFDNVQCVWTDLAPHLASRSVSAAEQMGMGSDINAIYAELGKDPQEMCKLARALSEVRLEKKTGEFQ